MKTEVLLSELNHSDVPTLKTIKIPAVTVAYGHVMVPTGKILDFDVLSFNQGPTSSTLKVQRRDNKRICHVQKFGDMPARVK